MVLNPAVRQLPTTSNAIRLDGSYLVVIAEPGYGAVIAKFARRNAEGTDGELKTMGQFLMDLQIVTEMMGRIGQLPKL
ncbi:hypothetical protein SAMN05216605_10929 [Pseudomonas abietaniphila]|uniref:Uncharacterized protein n=1 Tax=Pseudomonas abietaniphila TaxID=89065 RepID=A0A1G8G6J5_9PSED|nr:hypothetical protein SAMN05216605_10929 [Pseudomonas abietaniphila]